MNTRAAIEPLRFTPALLERPPVSGIDAVTTLRHFAIVTYAVPPERLQGVLHPRLELECVSLEGQQRALLSVVPFEDRDFRLAAFPGPRFRFCQTNYRIYVRDRRTGARVVWFLGTTLGSRSVALPRYIWQLPWHFGRFRMDCEQESSGRYSCFRLATDSRWASARVELEDTNEPPEFAGFPDAETGLVMLTHPLTGYYSGATVVWVRMPCGMSA